MFVDIVDKKSQRIICTAFANGKRHDFRLFKESKTLIHPEIGVLTDTGYQGLQKIHAKTQKLGADAMNFERGLLFDVVG